MRRSVDISNYQGALTVEQFGLIRDAGYFLVTCGTDGNAANPLVYPQQVANAVAAGLEVEAYVYLYFEMGDADLLARVQSRLEMIRQNGHVSRVWLDCEDTQGTASPEDRVGLIASARDLVRAAGFEPGIYTGRWWWPAYTGDNALFWDLKCWTAAYSDGGLEGLQGYGSWTEERAERGHPGLFYRRQWTDEGRLPGLDFDLDLDIDLDVVAAPVAPPAPPPPAAADLDGIRRRLEAARQAIDDALGLIP